MSGKVNFLENSALVYFHFLQSKSNPTCTLQAYVFKTTYM